MFFAVSSGAFLGSKSTVLLHTDVTRANIVMQCCEPNRESVSAWLLRNGFGKYIERFQSEDIDGWDVVAELQEHHLKELGMTIGDRLRFSRRQSTIRRSHQVAATETPNWQCTSLLDFADARAGHWLYDVISLHVDVFRCNTALLKVFLDRFVFFMSTSSVLVPPLSVLNTYCP